LSDASEALKIDKGQLSRWENDNPRPTLDNLGRLLVGYGVTVVDLGNELSAPLQATPRPKSEDRGPSDEELIRSLAEALRRLEGRQEETESRVKRLERELEREAGR
jgi:transcriptional regulator with XRE-family HTH domain